MLLLGSLEHASQKIICNEIESGSNFDCSVILQASHMLYDLHHDLATCTHKLLAINSAAIRANAMILKNTLRSGYA